MKKIDHDIQIFAHQRKGTAVPAVPFLWFSFRQKVEVGCYAGFTLRTYSHTSNPMQVKAAETIGNVMGKNL